MVLDLVLLGSFAALLALSWSKCAEVYEEEQVSSGFAATVVRSNRLFSWVLITGAASAATFCSALILGTDAVNAIQDLLTGLSYVASIAATA